MPKKVEAEATLENCRALIDEINAGLSAKEPFISASSATELLLYLEFATSLLKKLDAPRLQLDAPRSRERRKIVRNYLSLHRRDL
jgi:hypothetical protein